MLIAKGDLWTFPAEYRLITTNGVVKPNGRLVMGAGVALQCVQKYPGIDLILGGWVKQYGNRAFICKEHGVITFPTKHHFLTNSCEALIIKSAKEIVNIVDKYKINSVVSSRPGCGNGGLRWESVRLLIDTVFDKRFTIVDL